MRNFVIALVGLLFIVSCNSTQSAAKTTENLKSLSEWVDGKKIKVVANSASPLAANEFANFGLLPQGSTANRIFLTGNDFISIKGDHVVVDLPYYGVRQQSTAFDYNNSGVRFEGIPDHYEVKYDEKRRTYTMEMELKNGKEAFDVMIKLYPTLRATIHVNTTRRTAISYQARVKELPADTK
ncbi:DUF4251 domain-containing protein [Pseudotenacibaculum haliotis]|uniref:DUF4251 domain-containing protein n=1 Tax=Pseudotenacibaculum haliotis TaxID=1862138 RepID=A0ABW5LTT1_9FLAO